ncbi:hypothetical protein Tco_1421215 [Tanacetum coccineum]
MRLKTDIKPKEATFQVVLDALALTPFYQAFLITAEVPAIYMQEFWATVSVHKLSIRFTISKKKVSLDVDIFIEILQFCPKIPGQEFEDLPLEHNILSFIRDLGHSRDIIHLSDVSVDCLHQPWRAFATIINKCLSGKETGMDKIRLSQNKEANHEDKFKRRPWSLSCIHQALSFVPAIVDRYIDNKLGEAINKAILAHNLDCRQEAQDEKNAYIELVDTSMRAIIKEEVNTQIPQTLPQAVSDFANPVIEKNITESLEAAVLTRTSLQLKSTYEAATSLSEFELKKILQDEMEESNHTSKLLLFKSQIL